MGAILLCIIQYISVLKVNLYQTLIFQMVETE